MQLFLPFDVVQSIVIEILATHTRATGKPAILLQYGPNGCGPGVHSVSLSLSIAQKYDGAHVQLNLYSS